MSYFKAQMHQIRLRLGLRPIPSWGSSHTYQNPGAAHDTTRHEWMFLLCRGWSYTTGT